MFFEVLAKNYVGHSVMRSRLKFIVTLVISCKALGQIRTFKPPTLIFDVLGPSRVPRSAPQCCGHQHGFLQYLQDSVFGTL